MFTCSTNALLRRTDSFLSLFIYTSEAPVIVEARKRLEVQSQTMVTLPCMVRYTHDRNSDIVIEWTKDGQSIAADNTILHTITTTTYEKSVIVLNAVTMSDQGRYQCSVRTSTMGFDAPKQMATTTLLVVLGIQCPF